MNPENPQQNINPNVPPQPNNQLYPPNPAPQGYGQQGYSPFPVTPPPVIPPKKKSKLIIVIGIVLSVLIIGTIAAVVLTGNKKANGPAGAPKLSRAYDSPVGLLPAFQSRDVNAGSFKVTASYVTGGDFTREGNLVVNDSGHVSYEMVTDDVKVNELLKALYMKSNPKLPFDPVRHATTRNMSYDFASMLGYHYLFDEDSGPMRGFVPEVEAAKALPKPPARFTLTTACDSALAKAKQQTDISTTSVHFEQTGESAGRTSVQITFSSMQAIDKAVVAFFDACYDLEHTQNTALKSMVDRIRDDVTKSPVFTYGQDNGTDFVEVSAPPTDTPFGGKLRFEVKDSSTVARKLSGQTASYKERRNQFGLAYSLCRVDPVVTRTPMDGFRFVREDAAYVYPTSQDTGYYCKTTSLPSQFMLPKSVGLTSTTNKKATIAGNAVKGLAGFHDLTHEVEQYNLSNERYPGPTEFRDLANGGSGDIVAVVQKALTSRALVYTPLPARCVGTCNDYSLLFTPATGIQLIRSTYKAQ